jgi:Tol biopolymer transport system component
MQCVRLTRTLMVIFPLVISLLAGVTVISAKFLAREQPNPVNMGLIFQNTRNNAWYWVHADGTGLESLIEFSNVGFPDETHVDNGTLSPDGRWLAASSGSLDSIVLRFWLINMETRAMTLLNVPTATQKRFVWSPDSRFVAYIENGLVELIDIQSGVQTTLTDMRIVAGSSGSSSSLAWSPDSRQLIFD